MVNNILSECPAYRQQCKKCLGQNHFEKRCRINEVVCPENSAPSKHLDEVDASEYVYILEISCIPHDYVPAKPNFSNLPVTVNNLRKCSKRSESEVRAGRNQKASESDIKSYWIN